MAENRPPTRPSVPSRQDQARGIAAVRRVADIIATSNVHHTPEQAIRLCRSVLQELRRE